MKMWLLFFTMVILSSSVLATDRNPSYLKISHMGPEDFHLRSLLITTKKEIAQKFSSTVLSTVIEVDAEQFATLVNYFADEQKRNRWPKSDGRVVAEVMSFEVKNCFSDDSVNRFCFVMPAKASLESFDRLRLILEKEKREEALSKEIKDLEFHIRSALRK